MNGGPISRLQSQEPALLTALLTLVGGYLAQVGPGHVHSTKALGTSVTISGLQGILTRGSVISPATAASGPAAALRNSVTPLLAQGAEPALAMSFVGLVAGLLLQVVGGETNLLHALGVAAGLSGTQGVLTRQQVYSPRTVALNALAAARGQAAGTIVGAPPPPAPAAAPTAAGLRPPLAVTPGVQAPDPASQPGLVTLLQRYRPVVQYDSLESYYADSAAVIANRPGNVLRRRDGSAIAGSPPLGLDYLRPVRYPNGQPVAATDYIDETGGDPAAAARAMHAQPQYADRVHGRAVIDSAGATWLQYWLFMYYDDPGALGFGTHEGDIEMVQVRLGGGGEPDLATYSQHRSGLRATWDQVEKVPTADGAAPITYSARGSHANMLRAGTVISGRSFLPDHNDGRGRRVRPDLIVLSDAGTPWALWPGSWGGTRASGVLGDVGIAANSPTAPCRHTPWNDPAGFHASCDVPDDLPPPGAATGTDRAAPPTPALTVEPVAGATLVHYSIPAAPRGPAPEKIVVGLTSPDDSAPAATVTADVRGPSGTVVLPPRGAGLPTEVRATTHSAQGVASATAQAGV